MGDAGERVALAPRTYRWTDRLTKLGGVVLVAAGLAVGGHTPAGIALGLTGAALAISTVFVDRQTSPDCETPDE